MSLLLEARKKVQSAEENRATATEGLRPDNPTAYATEESRHAGQNLFSAKAPVPGHARPNAYLLSALGGTILLLSAGAGYWWYVDSSSSLTPQPPAPVQPIQPAAEAMPPSNAETPAENTATGEIAPEPALPVALPEPAIKPEPAMEPQARQKSPVRIEPHRAETIDPVLHDAYLAYRNGKPDEAQRLYLEMIRKDADNTDALLGLAAIAQQRGDNLQAAQYFSRVLMLDPRNAVANAGMSALNAEDDGNESRLKMLLREQNNSASLHFALGNLYAGQSRWSEAQQAYFNAWTLEPDNAEFAYNLAVSLDHLGQAVLAVRYYQRAQQLDAAHGAGFDHAQVLRRIEVLGQPGR